MWRILDLHIIIIISLQLLVNELIKEGKINMRTVTSGDESCDLYWLCHPQEKKVIWYKTICERNIRPFGAKYIHRILSIFIVIP